MRSRRKAFDWTIQANYLDVKIVCDGKLNDDGQPG